MVATVKKNDDNVVTLIGPSSRPFNRFKVKYAANGDKTLLYPDTLGLNRDWLHYDRAPVGLAATQEEKENLKKMHKDFPYWGHLIHKHIKEFNAKSHGRRRMLVYDLRHGKADHNEWKEVWGTDKWATDPEYKRQPVFDFKHKGKRYQYCTVDPPLTGLGKKQAQEANNLLHKLRDHRFPMPKRAYVSPLLRAEQTFDLALEGIDIEYEKTEDLREKKTGNCADILIDEFISKVKPIKPPQAVTGRFDHLDWMETDEDVQNRAKTALEHMLSVDDSDCVIRVTHSLLIQNNLKSLEATNGKTHMLEKFMLAEGGLFAYVIEGDKATTSGGEKRKATKPETVRRRDSAFGKPEAHTQFSEVVIEPEILAALDGNKKLDSKNNLNLNSKKVDSKKVDSRNVDSKNDGKRNNARSILKRPQ